jgi:superfamily II DNA/RNA helicase
MKTKREFTPEQKEVKRLYDIEYYKKNVDKIKEREKNRDKEKKSEYDKKYREENKDKFIQYQEENKELIKQKKKDYRKKNKEAIKEYMSAYRKEKKEQINLYKKNYHNEKIKSNPLYKLSCNIRTLIRASLNGKGHKKKTKTQLILGCTFDEFKQHLENKFESWMTWDNYGNWNGTPTEPNTAWDIDHIIPNSCGLNESEVIKLNHYTNLQPLCAYTNRNLKRNNPDF